MGFFIQKPEHKYRFDSIHEIQTHLSPWPEYFHTGCKSYVWPNWNKLADSRFFTRCLCGDTIEAAYESKNILQKLPDQLRRIDRKLGEDLLETAYQSFKAIESGCSVVTKLQENYRKSRTHAQECYPKLFRTWENLYKELADGLQEATILSQTCSSSLCKLIDKLEASRMAKKSEVHYHIANVGVINNGKARDIEANLNVLSDEGQPQVANAIQQVTQAVVDSELDDATKEAVIEQLRELSKQATIARSNRLADSVLRSILSSLGVTLAAAGGLAEVWSTWGSQIADFFGLG